MGARKELIDYYHVVLKDAAEFHLMVNFHGSNKPTGGERTWPNELWREGAYELKQRTIARDELLTFAMRAAGGAVVWLVPEPESGR